MPTAHSPSAWGESVLRDVRYATRALRRTPGFTAVALATLALGIGANAAIFSVVNAVLLRPLPYAEPERLVRIFETFNNGAGQGSVSWPNFRDWRERARGFDQLAVFASQGLTLSGVGEAERVRATAITGNAFPTLGARALLGRALAPSDDEPSAPRVAVLSEGYWRRRFGADPSVVGRIVMLDLAPHAVVGVMPAGFEFPAGRGGTDLWTAFRVAEPQASQRGSHWFNVVGRVRPGVTIEQATADIRAVAAELAREYPEAQEGRSVQVVPLHDSVVGRVRPALVALLAAVGLVLLIACANVANLLLARAAARRRDVAVRLALGASRAQLVRHFLAESVLLALGGGLLGVALARAGLGALDKLPGLRLPVVGEVALDERVLAVLLAVSVVCGIGFGLAPALQARPGRLRDDLTGGGTKMSGGVGQRRMRDALVVAQVALSLMLLVGAGLVMRGFLRLRDTASGLDPSNVLTMRLSVPEGRYAEGSVVEAYYRPVLERVRSLPGVREVGVINLLPIDSWGTNGDFWLDGGPRPPAGRIPLAELRIVSPGYFRALGIPLRAGRWLEERESAGQPVLVNETLVRRYLADGQPALGRRLRRGDDEGSVFTVVGVVGDVRQSGLDSDPRPEMYFPYGHRAVAAFFADLTLVVKGTTAAAALTPAVRQAVAAVAPDQPVYSVLTMDEVISASLANRRLSLWLLGIFAAIAAALAAAGLYGVISYLVAQRTREIGIRLALGADRANIVRLVVGRGAALAGVGIALGLGAAAAAAKLIAGLVYGVSARDPLTYAAVALGLGAVALGASWAPARRAGRVDPLVALRAE